MLALPLLSSTTLLTLTLTLTTLAHSLHLLRNPSSTTPLPFNATILDQSAHDITPLFQIRLFLPPPTNNNLTARTSIGPIRLINYCPLASETFVSSHCTPSSSSSSSSPSSLQAYTRTCRRDSGPVWRTPAGAPPESTHRGFCNDEEICVDLTDDPSPLRPSDASGAATTTASRAPVAACVEKIAYETWNTVRQWGYEAGDELKWAEALKFAGKRVQVRTSVGGEGRVGLEMGRLEVEVGEKGGVGWEREAVCGECVGLGTGVLPGGTEGLRLEAGVMGAVGGGVAGVLWLAALSG